MSSQDTTKPPPSTSKESIVNNNISLSVTRDNTNNDSNSSTPNVPTSINSTPFHSKSSLTSFPIPTQRTNLSSSSVSPLNINISTSFLNSPLAQSPSQLFSPTISVSSFVPGNNNYSSSIQKSISALDVKAMARDISMVGDSLNTEDSWPSLVVRVLPLFNGERLNGHIEDLNEVVRACLRSVDVATLTRDIYKDLLSAGMFTINAKLVGVHEDKVASRLVELWSFFLGTVLPYLEGVFLPHQIELLKLKRAHNLNSVRTMVLTSFKEQVIVPFMERLEASIHQLFKEEASAPHSRDDSAAKLLQMMSILSMTPPISNPADQKKFDHISSLLKNKWKERLHRV